MRPCAKGSGTWPVSQSKFSPRCRFRLPDLMVKKQFQLFKLDSICPTPSGKIGGVMIKKSAAAPRTISSFARLPFSFRSALRDRRFSGFRANDRFLTVGSRVAEGYHALQPSKTTPEIFRASFERQTSSSAAQTSLLTVKTHTRAAYAGFQPPKSAFYTARPCFDRPKSAPNIIGHRASQVLPIFPPISSISSAAEAVRGTATKNKKQKVS